jgi:hypothetical protein
MSLYDRIVEGVEPKRLEGKVGTLLRASHIHQAVNVGGAIRAACRPRNVSAVLRIAPRLDASDVTCPRCKKLVESWPNTPAARLPYARDERYPAKGERPALEAPSEEPEQQLDNPGPGNVDARTLVRAAGSKMHKQREPVARPVSAKLHRRKLRTPTPGIPG